MKKTIIVLIVILTGLLIGILACNSSNEENKHGIKLSAESKAAIEQVGVLHNQGLDTVFADIMREKIRLFKESVKVPSTRGYSTGGFPETFDFGELIHNTTKRITKDWNPNLKDAFFEEIVPKQKMEFYTRSTERESGIMDKFTFFQREYYSRLQAIVYQENITAECLKKAVLALEKEIEQGAITVEDAEQLLYATSVARYSAEYWESNATKWNAVLNAEITTICDKHGLTTRAGDEDKKSSFSYADLPEGYYPNPDNPNEFFYVTPERVAVLMKCPEGLYFNPKLCVCDWPWAWSWSDFVGADVEGAVTGAMGGAAAGVAAGGAGAIPGAAAGALGGAVVGSAGNAVSQWWEYMWKD